MSRVGRWKPERISNRVPRVKIPGIPNVDQLKVESMKIQYLSQGALIIKKRPKVGDKFVTTLGRLRENGRTDLEMCLFVHRCFFLAENYPPKAKVELCVTQAEGGKLFRSHFFIKEVLEPGPYASNPEKFCQHWAECGGCMFNGTRYARQLVEKHAWLAKSFPAERVFKVIPAVHGHNRFEHHVKWQQDGTLATGPEGFRSELETSPNECGRLPKRLYRAMREAAETFEKNYSNILEGICGRRADGNYEVVLNVFGTSTAKHNLKRKKGGLREFSPCLDPTDINIFRDRNPFVIGLTSKGGHHQVFGRKNTVRQHVKLHFVKKVYENGWMGNILGVYDSEKDDEVLNRDILVNTEISTTWGVLRHGIEENDGGNADSLVVAQSSEQTDAQSDQGPQSDAQSSEQKSELQAHLLKTLREKANILNPGAVSADHDPTSEEGRSGGLVLEQQPDESNDTRPHCNLSLPKKPSADYSKYIVPLDLELGFWRVPGRANIGEVADVLLEKFLVPMLDRCFSKSRHHSARRICIWEAGGSWPLAHCIATVFNKLKTSKEISVVSFQHPDDVELRRASIDFSLSRQEKEFSKVVQKKKSEDKVRRREARRQHQLQLYDAIRAEIMEAEGEEAATSTEAGTSTRVVRSLESRVAERLEKELVIYDQKGKDHKDSYFPPLTNLVADLNEQSTLERILVLTQQAENFDYDYSKFKSPGNVREELGAFHINKNSNPRMRGADSVDASDGALVPMKQEGAGGGSEEKGEELDSTLKTRLKKAFHALAKKYHPDLANDDHYAKKFQVLAKAYSDLTKDGGENEDEPTPDPEPSSGDANSCPVYFVHPDWRKKKSPTYIPPPDILILTLQDCMESTLRRWVRYHMQLSEFIILADCAVEHMKKPLYHFARLGYVVDYIQPVDTSPHRNEVLAIFKMRYVEEKRIHLDQESWLQIEAGNCFEGRMIREREKFKALTEGDMEKNRQMLLQAAAEDKARIQRFLPTSSTEGNKSGQVGPGLLAGSSLGSSSNGNSAPTLLLEDGTSSSGKDSPSGKGSSLEMTPADGNASENDPLWSVLEHRRRSKRFDVAKDEEALAEDE